VLDTTVTPNTTNVCTAGNTSGANVQLAPPAYTLWIYDISGGTLSPVLASEPGLTIVDPVVLQARTPTPGFVPDVVPTGAAGILANNPNAALGVLEIRSVYDFDGVDGVATLTTPAVPNIATLADPSQTIAARRPARFIRIEKAVEIPPPTVRAINGSAFGPAGMGMREILAYAPIEPDGSVKIQIPANVPFTIEILDANARRIFAPHTSWMQLMPGETKTCNGCHTAGSPTEPSHGRLGLTTIAYPGAAAAGALFPDTGAYPAVAAGDTMAEARVDTTCQSGAVAAGGGAAVCSEVPTIDVLYTDVWTDPTVRAVDPSISYTYAALTTPQPTNAHCVPWDPLCRVAIEYPLQIQPVWDFVRQPPVAPAAIAGLSCTSCHNPAAVAGAAQVPAGQLDLTSSPSTADATVTTSYEQLLFAHDEQALNMGVLGNLMDPGLVPVAGPVTAGRANGSNARFFSLFNGTFQDPSVGTAGYIDHTGFLTLAELRLISEWVDIGAQYYNNPFVAPAAN
jgi:hypothetical protein